MNESPDSASSTKSARLREHWWYPGDLLSLMVLAVRALPLGGGSRRAVAERLATLVGALTRKRAGLTLDKIQRGLGVELRPAEQQRVVRAYYSHLVARRDILWLGDPDRACNRDPGLADPQVDGLHYLKEALDRGRGVVLWESLIGDRLEAKVALARLGFRVTQVHGSTHGATWSRLGQGVIRPIYMKLALQLYDEVIELDATSLTSVRRLVELLNQNRAIAITALGNHGQAYAAVHCLNATRYVSTSIFTVARSTGAAIIPFFFYVDDNQTPRLVIDPPLVTNPRGQSKAEAMRQAVLTYVERLESLVRAHPGQWGSWHLEYDGSGPNPGARIVALERTSEVL